MKRLFLILLVALSALAVSCKKDNAKPINTIIVDGVSFNIEYAYISKSDYLDNHYAFCVGNIEKEVYFKIEFDGQTHLGKTTDLTKKDATDRPGWYWAVDGYIINYGIYADGDPDDSTIVFESGTLYTEKLGEDQDGNPIMRVELNGKVKDHNISIRFKSKAPLS